MSWEGGNNGNDGMIDSCNKSINTLSTVKCVKNASGATLPSILLSNVNRVYNKFDEINVLINREFSDIDLLCFTETWLDSNVSDSV